MEDVTQQLHEQVNELFSLVSQVEGYLKEKATPVSRKLRDSFANFHQHYGQFSDISESGDLDLTMKRASNVAIFGRQLSQILTRMTELGDEVKGQAIALGEIAGKLRRKADEDRSTFRPLEAGPVPRPANPIALPPAMLKKLEQFMLDQEKQDDRIKRSLAENEKRSSDIRDEVDEIERKVAETLSKVEKTYDQALADLQSKNEQINSILGHASGRVIAGDYEKSASAEKNSADGLRWGSLVCMALIVVVLGYSFWETVSADFQWQKSLFRVALAFLLSAPAAYLARESSKHRMQQYQHHQTSLDLKAIAPYLASLPDDLQHRIKSEVASKLFAGRDLSHLGSDSYPLNTHEILMELVKKLEFPKTNTNEK